MLRRQFIQLCAAAFVAPALGKLEALAPSPGGPILAIEMTQPLWLLEMQAYERFFAAHVGVRRRDIPKLPVRPLEGDQW